MASEVADKEQSMRPRFWGAWPEVVFLIVCLVVGLVLSQVYAPSPIVGVARFDGLIDTSSAEQMGKILETARRDHRIAAVVVAIDSYGGDARSSESLYHAMVQLRQEKPVVVVIDGAATSGAYQMAIAGNKIYAPAVSDVGNVGALMSRPWDPEIYPEVLSTGPFKLNGGSRFDYIRQLELVRDAFLAAVVNERSASEYNPLRIDASELAEARVYLGSEALALGLIDAQGSLSDAILAAAGLAGLGDYQVVDLSEYLGLPFESVYYYAGAQSLVDSALPGTAFLLDSRVPLAAGRTGLLRSDETYTSTWNDSRPNGVQTAPANVKTTGED